MVAFPRTRRAAKGVIPNRAAINKSHPALQGVGEGDLFVHDGLRSSGRLAGKQTSPVTSTPTKIRKFDRGLALHTPTRDTDGGVEVDIDMTGWGELTVISVINCSIIASSTAETSQLRWATSSSGGVAQSLLRVTSSLYKLRCLIWTDGTSLWREGVDATLPASYVDKDIVVAMTWDGAKRYMYAGMVGQPLTFLRSDNCTGAISAQSGATCRLHGGAYSLSEGQGRQYLTLVKSSTTYHTDLNKISADISSLFEPQREYWALASGVTDTTAPILSSPTGTKTGSTTADGSVSTDEANGTLYYLASENATETAATIKTGSSQAVTATGVQNVSVTGLTPSTLYYLHYIHDDAASNESNVQTSASFTTDAASTFQAAWAAKSNNLLGSGFR